MEEKQCDSCIHRHVCRLRDSYNELMEQIKTGSGSGNIFTLTLTCPHYRPETPKLGNRGIEITE